MIPDIFRITSERKFNALALEIFYLQAEKNEVYKNYLLQLNINPKKISDINKIPFLPIEFFKTHKVELSREFGVRRQKENSKLQTVSELRTPDSRLFTSSGTTNQSRSKHYVTDISIYEKSFSKCFELFYGNIEKHCILALLPSYLERKHSSLVYMADSLINKTKNKHSGFYLNNYHELAKKLELLEKKKQKTILLGVSFALLDFAEKFPIKRNHTIIMETGGMKGKRKEMVREELHQKLCHLFGAKSIHSEYGMTELLSQAYSKGSGVFQCPPWMKILIRDTNDNFQILKNGLTGGINIIDLANINSCSFIATQDLGKLHSDNSFEVLGRFDNSDLRGCNLLVE